ncbi:hypothetical protein KIN20_017241 [Parelaphostrongylus tenuis]|uniref:Uncharacterized protein n=1 Tax=Parelaphostrongylus tenuis TaxID=148309 RepID=A0AAD5N2D4_PARTN|nr:hypothetical protein KIN20_017241 [Parelaphostrongylus tenuis]
MGIIAIIKILPTNSFVISLMAAISTVLGCGVVPAGQASTRTFTVSGFSLPVAMVYTDMPMESVRVSGLPSDKGVAQAFVSRLVMQTVFDVLESQARSALLPDAVISTILSQLTVNITYEPLLCQRVALSLKEEVKMGEPRCIVIGSTVTGICTTTMQVNQKCDTPNVTIMPVSANFTSISGTLMV